MGASNCCPELMWGDLAALTPYYKYVCSYPRLYEG
jgi:hypothetical protein